MILLDVSFGIFAFLPQGWLFMAFVILMESVIMSKILNGRWFNKRTYAVTSLTNLVSGTVGIITTLILNGGWFLVVWFPWVSCNEIDISKKRYLRELIMFYIAAFILSVIIELIINGLFFRKLFGVKQTVRATFIVNIISYIIGSFVLYSYSFS